MSVNCKTKQYYSSNYKEYISSTQNVDMTEHYNQFLPHLFQGAKILDIGFGSGRDMLYFSSKGYNVFGIDNVSEFVDNGKANGLNVELCDFHNIPSFTENITFIIPVFSKFFKLSADKKGNNFSVSGKNGLLFYILLLYYKQYDVAIHQQKLMEYSYVKKLLFM